MYMYIYVYIVELTKNLKIKKEVGITLKIRKQVASYVAKK